MEFNINDNIVCIYACYSLTLGKNYTVLGFDHLNRLLVINDRQELMFYFPWRFEQNLKKLRKEKLNKIYESR